MIDKDAEIARLRAALVETEGSAKINGALCDLGLANADAWKEETIRIRAEIAEAKSALALKDGELWASKTNAEEIIIEHLDRIKKLRADLAAARELLREAIPHLVGNGHWDGVARIQSHLALVEKEKSEK